MAEKNPVFTVAHTIGCCIASFANFLYCYRLTAYHPVLCITIVYTKTGFLWYFLLDIFISVFRIGVFFSNRCKLFDFARDIFTAHCVDILPIEIFVHFCLSIPASELPVLEVTFFAFLASFSIK